MGLFSLFSRKEETLVEKKVSKDTSSSYSREEDSSSAGIPVFQGDYAKTVFLWAVSKSGPVRERDGYPRYLTYECGIRNPRMYHEQMIREGYLVEDSIEDSFMSLKAVELKEIAVALGVPSNGKKADLVSRIIESGGDNCISAYRPITYSLSEKGNAFLSDHDSYVQLHRHSAWGINWREYDQTHKGGESFYDTALMILKKRAANDNRLFGRQEFLSMYQLFAEKGDREKALDMLLRILYIDVSGVSGIESYKYCKQKMFSKKQLIEWYGINIYLAPGILTPFSNYADLYSDALVDKLYSWKLPVQICPKSLFLRMVHDAVAGSIDTEKYNKELELSYRKFVNGL